MITDGQGQPLAIELTAANLADTKTLEPMLDAVQPIARPKGRPRKRPHKAHADKGYDSARNRAACRRRGSSLGSHDEESSPPRNWGGTAGKWSAFLPGCTDTVGF